MSCFRYFTQPNAKAWLINSNFQNSPGYSVFLGNALAYSILYKFGGTILDFDTLLTRSLTPLADSFISRCNDPDSLSALPIAMPDKHPLVYDLLKVSCFFTRSSYCSNLPHSGKKLHSIIVWFTSKQLAYNCAGDCIKRCC